MEQDEAEANMHSLLEPLHCLKKWKLEELNEIKNDLHYIKEDIKAVQRRRVDLYHMKERHSVRLRMFALDSPTAIACPSFARDTVNTIPSVSSMQDQKILGPQNKDDDVNTPVCSQGLARDTAFGCIDLEHLTLSGLIMASKRQIHMQSCGTGIFSIQPTSYQGEFMFPNLWSFHATENHGREKTYYQASPIFLAVLSS
ncbi:hypothetical protein Ancab_004819 [Ancistrocladus abbreviatus]